MNLKLTQIRYPAEGQPIEEELLSLKICQIPDDKAYKARLREINETYRTIRDKETGCAFEIAIVNEKQLKHGALLMPSTMFSSLTQNIGNAIELAAHGAVLPQVARVYVAFPGNGKSDDLRPSDRKYLRLKGRFTKDGEALASISALARALKQEGIAVTSVSTNAEAGRFGLGILAALPPDTVTSVYLNGLPGVCPPPSGSYMATMMKIDVEDQKQRRIENLSEKYRVNDRTKREARLFMPKIYRRDLHYFFVLLSIYLRAMPNLFANILGFGRQEQSDLQFPKAHAVLQDMLVALKRQRRAKVSLQFGRLSELHRMDQCRDFCQFVAEELRRTVGQCDVQLLIDNIGTLDFHTNSPSKRWAAERYALGLLPDEECIQESR